MDKISAIFIQNSIKPKKIKELSTCEQYWMSLNPLHRTELIKPLS